MAIEESNWVFLVVLSFMDTGWFSPEVELRYSARWGIEGECRSAADHPAGSSVDKTLIAALLCSLVASHTTKLCGAAQLIM